jgi:twitching motility protein PilT
MTNLEPLRKALGRNLQNNAEKRSHTRYAANASAQIMELQSQVILRARITDLGLRGCYVDTVNPFPMGTVVQIHMAAEKHSFQCKGRVVHGTTGLGMGVAFSDIAPEQETALREWLAALIGRNDPGATPPKGLVAVPTSEEVAVTGYVADTTPSVSTQSLISQMLQGSSSVSDLILSPYQAPHVRLNGQVVQVHVPDLEILTPKQTEHIAMDIIGENRTAQEKLKEDGSCDLSYSIPGVARLRVNIFKQRGTHAIVMRPIPTNMPDFSTLSLPEQLAQIIEPKTGLILVTGSTGSGKTSTLAALLNLINETKSYHIITIEDPIEFTHNHKKSVFNQRELHNDTSSFDLALRAALRQSPDVILVGEMLDKQTIEIALEAAETGHLVFSTLHTIDASAAVERIIGAFPLGDQQAIRTRLARSFRYIVSQRLVPKKNSSGRVAVVEILKSTLRTQQYVLHGESEGKTLLDAIRDGANEGMQHFDGEIEKLVRKGVVDLEMGLSFATNPGNLRLEMADLIEETKTNSSEHGPSESELEIVR